MDVLQLKFITKYCYYGGDDSETITGITSINQEYYFLGQTSSTNDISTLHSFQSDLNGLKNLFVLKMDEFGNRIWCTYYGGNNYELPGKIAIGKNYNLFFTGLTTSANDISTFNSYQASLNGGEDAFLVKFNDCPKPELENEIFGEDEICSSSIITYEVEESDLAQKYIWILPSGWQGESDSNSIEITIGNDDGTLQVYAVSSCGGISDTLSLEITVLPVPEPAIVNNNNILSTSQAYNFYQWMKDGVDIVGETNALFTAVENGTYQVRVIGNNECEGISNEEIIDNLAIQDIANVEWMKVYPNPIKDNLIIESEQELKGNLYAVDGRVIKDWKIKTGINQFDLENLSTGVYYLELLDVKMNKYRMKIIKK